MGIKESSSTLIKLKSSIRYFSFFSKKKMKISYSCLIVAVVIGLGTVTADPADHVKAVAADEYDAKLARLVREAAGTSDCDTCPNAPRPKCGKCEALGTREDACGCKTYVCCELQNGYKVDRNMGVREVLLFCR